MLAVNCTTTDGKPVKAEDVGYDNTTSRLLSTSVQAAVDDLASMTMGQDERLGALEGSRNVIYCLFATSSLSVPAGTTAPHVFSTTECGGTLPDANYVGALARYNTCSVSIVAIEVMNSGEPDGPGIVLSKSGTADCAGPAVLAAVFYKLR